MPQSTMFDLLHGIAKLPRTERFAAFLRADEWAFAEELRAMHAGDQKTERWWEKLRAHIWGVQGAWILQGKLFA